MGVVVVVWGSWCFGVCPVFAVVVLPLPVVWLRGCGVVVWELYSEREHLADEMSRVALFLGLPGV